MKYFLTITGLCLLFSVPAGAQYRFSIATDLGALRSFKNDQRYTSFCHTVQVNFQVAPKNVVYFWFSHSSHGNFYNDLEAVAKLPGTFPQTIPFSNRATMHLKEFSFGWKHYFTGSAMADKKIGFYGDFGFGLMLGKVKNRYNGVVIIDTAQYNLPANPVPGEGRFKRLTIDLVLGWELPLGAEIYFYNEARALVPASDYPSKFLFVNQRAPFVASVSAGIRIMF